MPNLREGFGQSVEEEEDIQILKDTFLYGERMLGELPNDVDTAELRQNRLLKQFKDSHQRHIVGGLDPIKLAQSLFLPPGPSHIVKSSHIHAVIIGINMYKSYPLRGCVSDARLIEKYLTEVFGVPKDHIQLLLGSEEHTSPDDPMNPSRANIIHALLSLAANDEIKDGDIIIIYFAGHGSSYWSPDDVAIYGVIETLCPIDRDTQNNDGKAIPDISDRELNAILSLITNSKRSRITVILDCCHGDGASRDLPGLGARTSPQTIHTTLQDMLLAGEENMKNHPGYRSILSKNWCPDMDCHVILTACKEFQFASEKRVEGKDGGYIGFFTESLYS
ncbi:caspase domain-containing protein [Armillaria mellea]|nr:caspase domain-containing protein [Armillaria mellea]